MMLAIAFLISVIVGITVILLFGKGNIKRIIAPLLILLLGNFLLLYAKFVVGDPILTLILHLPAMLLLAISVIWWIIFWVRNISGKVSKKKILAIILCLIMTTVIIFIPTLDRDDTFKLYRDDYFAVSDAIFQAYDDGKVLVGDQFASEPYSTSDLDRMNTFFSNKVINKMKKLNRSAGVNTYIVADEDVIYFSFGAVFQSISGIAICRNDKDPSTDKELHSRFFDGVPTYTNIGEDGVYLFFDGL